MMESWDGSTGTTTQVYSFEDEGWPTGGLPSFEEDLFRSQRQDDARRNCIRVITQVKNDRNMMEEVKKYAPKLHGRIMEDEAAEFILPTPNSGMTPGSLKYVIEHLIGRNTPPTLGNSQDIYLKWITQITITIWEYECDRTIFHRLQQHVSDFILNTDFTPNKNAAAYLAIISFVLGGELNEKLPEYLEAVVWRSRFELACALKPLQAIIQHERIVSLECMFRHLQGVFLNLALTHNQYLASLGEKLNDRLKLETQSQLNFGTVSFEDVLALECAKFPAKFEETLLGALNSELNHLRTRTPTFRVHTSGDLNGSPGSPASPGSRQGAGSELWDWLRRGMKGEHRHKKEETFQSPESQTRCILGIIDGLNDVLEKRRRHIADSVGDLIKERDNERHGAADTVFLPNGQGGGGGGGGGRGGDGGERGLYQHWNGSASNEQWR